MNATLRHWALLAAFTIPFAFAGLALIDAVLLANEPDTSVNADSLCSGMCTTASPAAPDSGSPAGSSPLPTATTTRAVLYSD